MRTQLSAVVVLVMLTLTPAIAEARTPSPDEIDEAIRFRSEFGLPSSLNLVSNTYDDTAKYSDLSWGVPLSKAEATDLDGRLRRIQATWPALNVAADQDGFGGVYFDQLRGGVPVFLFSSNHEAAAGQVRRTIGGETQVEVEKVQRSLKRLERVRQAIFGSREQLAEGGVQLTSVGFDIEDNLVEVGVLNNVGRAESLLEEHGQAVRVVQQNTPVFDACVSAKECPPAKGGIRIDGTNSYCTSGFMAKRTDEGDPYLVLITAGHCLQFAHSGSGPWKHDDESVGWSDGRVFEAKSPPQAYPVLPTDVGIIDLKQSFEPTNKNRILTTNTGTIMTVGSWALSPGFHVVGTPVCRMGAGSASKQGWPARKCGQVNQYRQTNLSCKSAGEGPPCAWIEDTMRVSFDSTGGDSGGPYWFGNAGTDSPLMAMGIHVHSQVDGDDPDDKRGWYTPISLAIGQLAIRKDIHVSICLASNC